jgi:hypothetical protein
MSSEAVGFQLTSAARKILRHIGDPNLSQRFHWGAKQKKANAYLPCFFAIHSRQRIARIGPPSPLAIFKGNAAS